MQSAYVSAQSYEKYAYPTPYFTNFLLLGRFILQFLCLQNALFYKFLALANRGESVRFYPEKKYIHSYNCIEHVLHPANQLSQLVPFETSPRTLRYVVT